MNREIKFRLWSNYANRFLESTPRVQFKNGVTLLSCEEDCVIEQFTGLLDKNGKEIYEDDILSCGDRIVKVGWNEPNGTWDSTFLMYTNEPLCSNGINVVEWKYRAIKIGNIHDNPELLK